MEGRYANAGWTVYNFMLMINIEVQKNWEHTV